MIEQPTTPPPALLADVRERFAAGDYPRAYQLGLHLWHHGSGADRRLGVQLAVRSAHRLGNYGDAVNLLPQALEAWADHAQAPEFFDLLGSAVMCFGGLAHYEDMIEAMRRLHSHPSRSGSLAYHVRARMLAAVGLGLLGDTWAGLRILSEAAGHLKSLAHMPEAELIEASVLANHAGVCVMSAWVHHDKGDIEGCKQQLTAAKQSATRARELALAHGEHRLAAFSDLHDAEFAIAWPTRQPPFDLTRLYSSLEHAKVHHLPGEVRTMSLVLAQSLYESGEHAQAAAVLDSIEAASRPEHDLSCRLRYWKLRHLVWRALGDATAAFAALEEWSALQRWHHAALLHAQSSTLRRRLELEHIYRQPWRNTA